MADANNNITYSLADIQRYLQGEMNAREMHELERAALEDPFLADALEGYSEADMQQAQQHLAQIDKAIRREPQKGKVVAFPALQKYRSWQVAAAVVILIGIAGITYFMAYNENHNVALAKNETTSVVTTADSLQAPAQTFISPNVDSTTIMRNETPTEKKDLLITQKKKNIAAAPAQSSAAPATTSMNDSIAYSGTLAEVATAKARIIKPRMSQRSIAAANEIAGTIIDNHQQPVPNATVILPDSTQTITDRNGNFKITTTDSNVVADIQAFGYKPLKNQQLSSGNNKLILKEKPFTFSDVEVINIGTEGKKTGDTTAVTPQGGWQSFQEYVYTKLQKKYDSMHKADVYISGNLQVEFSISDAGEPIDFKVLHAPDEQTAADAISTIKAGPKWINNNKRNKTRVRVNY